MKLNKIIISLLILVTFLYVGSIFFGIYKDAHFYKNSSLFIPLTEENIYSVRCENDIYYLSFKENENKIRTNIIGKAPDILPQLCDKQVKVKAKIIKNKQKPFCLPSSEANICQKELVTIDIIEFTEFVKL